MSDLYDLSYEQQCPACKTTKYRNPQMKLMVNVCGHALCDSCVKLLFIKESGQCPECDILLKRSKFRIQIFEDPLVEKEIDIRRKVMRIFCKQEEDFETNDEWDCYLETIEEIVFNLTNDVNKSEMEKKLEAYEKQNRDDIRKGSKKSQEDEELERLIEEEKLRHIERNRITQEEEQKALMNKIKTQSSLLEDLMASDGDASLIVKSHAERLKQTQEEEAQHLSNKAPKEQRMTEFSSGVKLSVASNQNMKPDLIFSIGEPYVYEAPLLPNCLPSPSWDELSKYGYLQHVRKAPPQSTAGGYSEHYACLRVLQEFMWGHVLPAS